jgi:hypothetical protein
MSRRCLKFCLVLAVVGGMLTYATGLKAAKLLEYNFSNTLAGPVVDGQPVQAAVPSAPFGSAELLNDVNGLDSQYQFNVWNNSGGPTANYAVESLPAFPANEDASIKSAIGWDGAGLGANGDIFIRAIDGANLNLPGPFSYFARVYHREGNNRNLGDGSNPKQAIISGGARGEFGGWDASTNNIDPSNDFDRLNVQFGTVADGSSAAMANGFGNTGPHIPFGQWFDIAVTFDGDSDADAGNNDEANEMAKVYLNGQLKGTFTGSAVFGTDFGGVFSAILGDTFGNTQWVGTYERYAIWDEVLTDTQVADMSFKRQIPEPTSALLIVLGGMAALAVGRRRNS